MDREQLIELTRHLRNYLGYMEALGVERLPYVQLDPLPPEQSEPVSSTNAATTAAPSFETLGDIRADLGDCTRCRLCEGRQSIVFGEGDPRARVMFVGEGPGRDEDVQGRPFVGAAGKLLTDIIVKGMRMRREDCYIANVVKCRPPNNRDPRPDEAETCLPFLRRQIAAIRPQVICALGRVASNHLLQTDDLPLGSLRHRFHDLNGIPVMPTYHPAALLRNQALKRGTWEDIKLIIAKLQEG